MPRQIIKLVTLDLDDTLWPNKKGMSVVLDLGANIECSSKNLLDFSIMGASLYTSLYPNDKPNVALLNIGSEELKGNEIIKETFQILNEKKSNNFNFSGYIEGNELMNGNVNVIISDGFTGNVALKTAEGTANFITDELKKVFKNSILGKLSAILNFSNLNKFKKRLDPRVYNGAIFIGLDSPVVKSHGGTDFIGFSNSLEVCSKIVKGDLINKIRENYFVTEVIEFTSILRNESEKSKTTRIKVIDDFYPLLGNVETEPINAIEELKKTQHLNDQILTEIIKEMELVLLICNGLKISF